MKRILFVCTGNICRSPSAEGVFRKRFADAGLNIMCDSAGTHDYHIGESPDARSIKAAKKRGVDITIQKARKFALPDFDIFDAIFALDAGHYEHINRLAKPEYKQKIHLLLSYVDHPHITDVPDPYYGSTDDFEHVLDLLEWAADAVTNDLLKKQTQD